MSAAPRQVRTWPYAMAGALLLFGAVVVIYAGDDEARNPIAVLGSFAAVVGALLGTLAGGIINAKRSDR